MQSYEKMAKIAVNKSILKEYSNQNDDRIVYLDDGSEFQIQLFNPHDYVIGVSVNLNADTFNISHDNLIVLKPGQRVWLDRHIENPAKLVFSTYEVSFSSSKVSNAIRNNGNVVIAFFKEKKPDNIEINQNFWEYNLPEINIPNTDIPSVIKTYYTTSCLGIPKDLNANVTRSEGISTFASTIGTSSVPSKPRSRNSRDIETGRIESGSHSNQSFTYTDHEFEWFPFQKEVIKLLPKSRKPTYAEDLVKRYCTSCGHKINQKFKYCPYCGTKV